MSSSKSTSSAQASSSSSPPPSLPTITLEELKKHNTKNDAWLALKGKVFNVTDYVSQHPGGAVIKQGFGIDATQLFNNAHSYVNFERILAGKQVGVLGTKK